MRRLLLCLLPGALLLGQLCAADGESASPPPPCNASVEECIDLNTCRPPTVTLTVPKDVILVLGNSGSGKSTLTKHLSHNDEDMKAVLEDEQFLINSSRSGSSIKSVTEVPELFVDNVTSASFYDCPGFEDSRGACVEVSTTFYMKDIARHVRRVKVLLLAQYFAVRKGQDRAAFITMLMHAARVLRAESKLADSLALVVTKVDVFEKRKREYFPMSLDKIKRGVVAFLDTDVSSFLAEKAAKAADPAERQDYRRAAKLVDIMVAKDQSGDYKNIGVFRTPDDVGPLKNITLMEDSRNGLLDLVHKRLRYADVQASDFGFSVSDRTKLFAMTKSRSVSDSVVRKLASLATSMATSRARRAYDPVDVPATARRLGQAANEVRSIAARLKNATTVQEFCTRMSDQFAGEDERALASDVETECRYLDVLQVVSDKPLVDNAVLSSQWTRPFEESARTLAAREAWSTYLVAVYNRLSKYDVQSKRVVSSQWFSPVSASNLSAFEAETTVLGLFSKLEASTANLSDLNALLRRVGSAPNMTCFGNGTLRVYAEFLLLSEIERMPRDCRAQLRNVEVYVLNTVFVDKDVRLPGVSLAVVAPRWEFLGDSTIILDGLPGAPPPRKHPEAAEGQRGADGAPGLPGKQGGNFLGLGLNFVGRGRVSLNGGAGGDGQAGGDGGPGKRGGGHGGNGGDGGAGGIGGYPGAGDAKTKHGVISGDVKIFAFRGRSGNGGRGGLRGDHRPFSGRLTRRKRVVLESILIVTGIAAIGGIAYVALKGSPPTPPPVPQFRDGNPGRDGAANLNQQNPDWVGVPAWDGVPSRMRTYLDLNVNHPYFKEELEQFMELLDTIEDQFLIDDDMSL